MRTSLLLIAACLLVCTAGVAARSHKSHSHVKKVPLLTDNEPLAVEGMLKWRERALSNEKMQIEAGSQALNWVYGQNNYTMSRPEGERDYYVYVPKSYTASKPVSFVFSLHGLGDNALHFSERTNLTVQSEIYGFILCYPQGYDGVLGTAWNAGTCCQDQNIDDDTFLLTVVGNIRSTFNIRSNSIHSMGFSNGGFMSERFGCMHADLFSSIASVSGDTILEPGNSGGLAACDAAYKNPTDILHVHGTWDLVVPWAGDVLLGFPSVDDNMGAWRARNKCTGNGVNTFNFSTFSNQLWSDCGDGGATVELVTNTGGGHIYPQPGSSGDPSGWSVTDYLLGFWNRVTPGGL
jgi:poly(3-hydroxybutyrate) depolymerase